MKIYLYSFVILLLAGMPMLVKAQEDTKPSDELSKSYYYSAKQELENMLNSKQPMSYERAIYLIENAWWDNTINYSAFQSVINSRVVVIKKMIEQRKGVPDKTTSTNFWDQLREYNHEKEGYYEKALANWGIYSYMADSSLGFTDENGFKYLINKTPYCYSTDDPLGTTDWTNTQITNLFLNGKGNCFALASLFKIFSERLNTDAKICTAPGHVYISHKDDKGREFNVEIASRAFPGIGTLSTLTHTTQDAIVNDISLRQLDLKQSVALCLVYLAKGYEHKLQPKEDDGFMMSCANTALKYDSLNLNAILLKAEVLESEIIQQGNAITQLQTNTVFKDYERLITRLYVLGYREMPLGMKNILIKGWMRDTVATLAAINYRLAEQADNTPSTRKASLSWGLFEEEITDKPMEKYGRTVYDTKRKKIARFVKEDVLYNDYNFDPVLFALNVDPMAHKYPHASPYNFVENNPISRIDPDGADWIVATYKNKQGQTQINLTFAGAVMNSSGKKIDMNKYIANEVKTFESIYGQGNVHASLHLREIKSAKDLKWHESLIDIQAGSKFKKNVDGSTTLGESRYGGKFIRLNADGIGATGVSRDKKTTVHEIGHTGGLIHPFEFDEKQSGTFVNGNPFSLGVQKFYNTENSLDLDANFMGYTAKSVADSKAINPMLSDGEKSEYFKNNVGASTEGQTQQIINNLYEGNLNSGKDLPHSPTR